MKRLAMGAVLVGVVLGCSGLMGYGEVMGRKTVTSGQPFNITFTTKAPEAHQVWFEIDLTAKGNYEVTGAMASGGEKWKVELDKSGSPIAGGSGRMTMNWVETSGSKSSAKGTIFATDLPEVPVGTKVTLKGKLTLSPGTKGKVDVVITE